MRNEHRRTKDVAEVVVAGGYKTTTSKAGGCLTESVDLVVCCPGASVFKYILGHAEQEILKYKDLGAAASMGHRHCDKQKKSMQSVERPAQQSWQSCIA
jgi:hypothetical protein